MDGDDDGGDGDGGEARGGDAAMDGWMDGWRMDGQWRAARPAAGGSVATTDRPTGGRRRAPGAAALTGPALTGVIDQSGAELKNGVFFFTCLGNTCLGVKRGRPRI